MKLTKVKKSICTGCKRKEICEDIPGFCLMLPYVAIGTIVALLIYFISNSHL